MAAADQGNVVVDGCLGGGADRISNLPDHLLHRILICLPNTTFAARTSVLSRRWRRVWTYVPELALRYYRPERVDAALAACSAPVLHRLEIDLPYNSRHVTAEHICSWLQFASERLAGELCLWLPWRGEGELVLPVCGRFTAISLAPAAGFSVRLRPAAGVFTAMAALTIKDARMESRELEQVVSSRCPRLKELVLENIILLTRDNTVSNVLSIRSDSVEKLRVGLDTFHDGHLQVATPELQELSLSLLGEGINAHIVAPKLSKVCWSKFYDPRRHQLLQAGCHVKRLELTNRSLALLDRFDAIDELDLDMFISEGPDGYQKVLKDTNKIIKCEALVVRILSLSHAIEPIILHLLQECVGLRKLVVRLSGFELYPCKLSRCPCDLTNNHFITNGIVLDSLQEVVVKGGGDATKLVSLLQMHSEKGALHYY